jgi:hypothetical protein
VEEHGRIGSNLQHSAGRYDVGLLVSWTKSRADQIPGDVKARLDKIGGTKTWNGRAWVGG